MKKSSILITNTAAQAIRREGIDFKPIGPQLINGCWLIPVSRDLLTEIESVALPGESVSETIIRTFAIL